jgi:hypothetical protein
LQSLLQRPSHQLYTGLRWGLQWCGSCDTSEDSRLLRRCSLSTPPETKTAGSFDPAIQNSQPLNQPEAKLRLRRGARSGILLCMGLFSRFFYWPLPQAL